MDDISKYSITSYLTY